MAQRFSTDWFKNRTPNVIGMVVIGYLVLGSGKLIIENYRIHHDMDRVNAEIAQLDEQNNQLQNLEAYYRTDSFKEKQARERLAYQKPGERVIIVPPPTGDDTSDLTKPGIQPKPPTPPSNPEQWWRYFFGQRNA